MIHKALVYPLWNGVLQVDKCILPTWMAFLLTVSAYLAISCTEPSLLGDILMKNRRNILACKQSLKMLRCCVLLPMMWA